MLARLAERVAQLLVLRRLLGELALRLEQTLLERAQPVGRVGQARAQVRDLLAEDLDLAVITPPIKLPKIEISQYWHERFHREPGNQWIRSIFARLFRVRASSPRADRH